MEWVFTNGNLLTEDLANVDGYFAFFSFSRKKGGYSGVATYCKQKFCPVSAEEGITGILQNDPKELLHNEMTLLSDEELKDLDAEGRAVLTEHETTQGERVWLFNLYCPRADVENEERYTYKMNFYKCLESRCKALIEAGNHVIVAGDLNVSHKRIDHCDPDDDFDKNIARIWFDQFLNGTSNLRKNSNMEKGILEHDEGNKEHDEFENVIDTFKDGVLIDTFRKFHPKQKDAFTAWSSRIRARETNYGTRIDYVLADKQLANLGFMTCRLRPDIEGSDHCPVESDVSFSFIQSSKVPDLCAINMPEVSGKQQRIKSYFTKNERSFENGSTGNEATCLPQSTLVIQTKRKSNDSEKDNAAAKRKKTGETKSLFGYFDKRRKQDKISEESHNQQKNFRVTEENTDTCAKEAKKSPVENILKSVRDRSKDKNAWKNILKGPEPAPLCSGHKEKCVLRTVKKEGANIGRQFYICHRPTGHTTNKEASCNFFVWKT